MKVVKDMFSYSCFELLKTMELKDNSKNLI
jgi:hypothetical protein